MPILPYATKMESKWLVGMWTPVTKCPATNCRPTRQGEEATPPTLLPLVLIELKHSLHNRIPAVDITQMVHYPQAPPTQGSPMLTRHPLRTIRMTKTDFTAIAMPWAATPNCLALVISAIRPKREITEALGCFLSSTTVKGSNHTSLGPRWPIIYNRCGRPLAVAALLPAQVHQIMSTVRAHPICTRCSLPHLFWPPPSPGWLPRPPLLTFSHCPRRHPRVHRPPPEAFIHRVQQRATSTMEVLTLLLDHTS